MLRLSGPEELSAGSFLKLTPWNNPTCPRMTWVSLAGASCGIAAAYNFSVFCLLQSLSFCKDENPTQNCPQVVATLFVSCRMRNLRAQSGKHNTTLSLCIAAGLVRVSTFRPMISYFERKIDCKDSSMRATDMFLRRRWGHRIGPDGRMRNGREASERRSNQAERERRLYLYSVCRSS